MRGLGLYRANGALDMDRLQSFSDALNSRYGSYALEPVPGFANAGGSLRSRSLDAMSLTVLDVTHVISRRQKLPSHLHGLAFVMAPVRGAITVDQYNRTSRLLPGDVLLLSADEACTIAVENQSTVLAAELSRSAFDRFGGVSPQICARRLEAGGRAGGIVANLLSALAEDSEPYKPGDGELIQDMLASLVGRIAVEGCGDGRPHQRGALTTQMRTWVKANIHDPHLSPGSLAEQFGLSRRGIFRHFASIGTTPARWLWEIRLECADERLRRSTCSVSEIAYSVGFNDSGHFARLYKRRFGSPPTARQNKRQVY